MDIHPFETEEKFFPTPTCYFATAFYNVLEHLGKGSKNIVTGVVSVGIVDALKKVHIADCYTKRFAGAVVFIKKKVLKYFLTFYNFYIIFLS